jgi:RNA polymerase sigma-70 factor (ECF subfamily)
MSVSSTNPQRQHAANGAANGNGSPKAAANDDDRNSPDDNAGAFNARASHVNRIPERTDEELLAAYRTGDHNSFAALVERYQRELFHFLVRFLGDRAAAEDIFQETFLQVHQSADQFDPQRRFRPWLFTIAANKARDLMRSQARRPTNPLQATINANDDDSGQFIDLMQSDAPMPGDALEREELQKTVQSTVEAMPEHLREILLLSYFHQFPYKEISEILKIPLGTVKSRLHAAVAYFAERWKNRIQRTNEG